MLFNLFVNNNCRKISKPVTRRGCIVTSNRIFLSDVHCAYNTCNFHTVYTISYIHKTLGVKQQTLILI